MAVKLESCLFYGFFTWYAVILATACTWPAMSGSVLKKVKSFFEVHTQQRLYLQRKNIYKQQIWLDWFKSFQMVPTPFEFSIEYSL